MAEQLELVVAQEEKGKRLDVFLGEQFPEKTRSFLQKIISQQAVTCSRQAFGEKLPPKGGGTTFYFYARPSGAGCSARRYSSGYCV